jgi:hypothetical protein
MELYNVEGVYFEDVREAEGYAWYCDAQRFTIEVGGCVIGYYELRAFGRAQRHEL